MESSIKVQILDEAVCLSFCTCMNPHGLHVPAMDPRDLHVPAMDPHDLLLPAMD